MASVVDLIFIKYEVAVPPVEVSQPLVVHTLQYVVLYTPHLIKHPTHHTQQLLGNQRIPWRTTSRSFERSHVAALNSSSSLVRFDAAVF